MSFDERWNDIVTHFITKSNSTEKIPTPTPDDVAEAMNEPSMAKAFQEMITRQNNVLDYIEKRDIQPDDLVGFVSSLIKSFGTITPLSIIRAFKTAGRSASNDEPWSLPAPTWIATFQSIHFYWELLLEKTSEGEEPDLKHPLVPLIKAWLDRPERLKPNTDAGGKSHSNGILPHGLFPKSPATVKAHLNLIPDDELALLPVGHVNRAEVELPLLAEMLDQNDVPCTPLILADAAGFRGLKPGRGARPDKRLLIYGLLRMRLDQRQPESKYDWRPPIEELRDLLWPPSLKTGKSSYRPSVHARVLTDALRAVSHAAIVLPDGRTWFPMITRSYPSLSKMGQPAILEIELPPGCEHGPQIDRQALIAAGVISDPAFDLEIALAYLWDDAKARNGGHRIYATRPVAIRNDQGYILNSTGEIILHNGKPVTNWNHPQAVLTGRHERHPQADKVRVLTAKARHGMAYGPRNDKDRRQLHNERKTTDRILNDIEVAGRIVIERDVYDARTGNRGWRILQAWQRH